MMIAAADLGIGSGHSAVGDQELAREILGFPEDRFCAHWCRSATRPSGRCPRCAVRTGGRSTKSSTAAAGSRRGR